MDVVIIDDETYARKVIESILIENFPHIRIVGQAGTVKKSIELLERKTPDLIFLDVDLPDGTGFDILGAIKNNNFRVIFITAHQEYAIKAIKFSAFDYILKPIHSEELIQAVKRVQAESESKSASANQSLKWAALFANVSENQNKVKKIVLKTAESIHLVNIDDIIRCEADNNYCTFYLFDGHKILISRGLKDYEELLRGDGFFRVHQSHLINLSCIVRFDKKDGGFVVLRDKSVIPVSQRKKQKLLDFFDGVR